MLRFVTTALCAALLSPASGHAQGLDFELFTRLTHKVIKVEALNPNGSVSMGTGVLVGHGMVVTNCHVTAQARIIELVRGEARWTVESQQADMDHDLCLLSAPHVSDLQPVQMGSDAPRVGQRVHAVGFIFGVAPRLNYGEINALHDYDGGKVIQSTTPFTSGASGGGLFDEEGRLVGIVTFKYRAGEAYHFSLPVRWVVEAMNRFEGQPVAPLAGTPFWARPREAQPAFLRAATFAAEHEWHRMLAVADDWVSHEPDNASAWRAQAKARAALGENAAAVDSLRNALRLDPDYAQSWYELGLAYATLGDESHVQEARKVLLGLDGKLASELERVAHDCNESGTRLC